MTITNMAFNPVSGLKDASYSPTTPVSETAIRAQIQGVSDQLRDYINVTTNPTIDTALLNATNAVTTANTSSTKSDTAISTANSANTKSDTAISTANSASSSASSAVSTANSASTTATNANNTALAVQTDYNAIKPQLEQAVLDVAGKASVAYVDGIAANFTLGAIPDNALTNAKMANEMKKGIAGGVASYDNVATSLADMTYQVATGTATAIVVATGTLTNGYAKTFIASANNNGSATTINTKPLYKPSTTTAPTLIVGKAYTVWYNTTGDCFFIKASATGTALPAQVLAGVPYSNDTDTDLVGTMVDRSYDVVGGYTTAKSVRTDGAGSLVFEPYTGYYEEGLNAGLFGSIISTDTDFIASNFLSTKNVFGLQGSIPIAIADEVGGAVNGTLTAGRVYIRPSAKKWDGNVFTYWDEPNFIATNLLSGKTYFGLTGTAIGINANLTAGDITFITTGISVNSTVTTMTKKREVQIAKGGTVRIKFTSYNTNTDGEAQIYVNGVARGILRILTPSSVEFSEDISINANDLIQCYLRAGQGTTYLTNFNIYTSLPYHTGTINL